MQNAAVHENIPQWGERAFSRRIILVRLFLVAAAYYVAFYASTALRFPETNSYIIWISGAVLLTALLIAPQRFWWAIILAISPVHLLTLWQTSVADFTIRFPGRLALVLLLAISIKWIVGPTINFAKLKDAGTFIFLAIVIPFFGALIISDLSVVVGFPYPPISWRHEFSSTTLAVLTLTPAFLVLANGRVIFLNLDFRRMFEMAALVAGLLAALVIAYVIQDSTTENFTVWILLTLPFLLWSALRFGTGLSSIIMMSVTLVTFWILHGSIVPSENTWPAQVISNLQLFLGLSAVFLLLLSARTEERTNAEDSLRAQEEQYRSVVETQSDLICRYRPDSTLTFVNEAYCRFFDKNRDELIGARFINLIPEGDRKAVLEHIASIVETKIESAHEHEVIRSDGEIGWHHWINQPIVDSNGVVTELQGIGRDITDRKRIEQALSISQSNFQDMADSLPILVYLMGKDGVLTFANKALLEFHGLDLGDIHDADLMASIHPEQRESERLQFAEAFRKREPYSCEFSMRAHNDENYRWFYNVSVPRFAPDRTFLGYVGSCTDVTDMRASHEALRMSEERFRELADLLPILVYEYGPDGKLTFGNRALLEFHGLEMGDLSEVDLSTRFHPEHRERMRQQVAEACELRQPFSGEFQMRRHDEEGYRWFYKVVVPRFADDGTFLGFLGSCTDITEVRTSHEELRASEERYRNVVESQRELICRYLPDGTLTFVNDAYCNYFQRSREDLLGKPFYSLLPEDEQKRTQEFVDSLVRDPRDEPMRHKVLLADGGIGWQEWVDHTITDSEGRFVEMQGIGRDITEQKLAEAALLESEQRFQSFMDNSPAAACIMDADARILYVNDTYRRLIKVPDGSIIGKTAFDLFDPKTADNLYRAVVNVTETGKPTFGFEEAPRPDGSLGSFLVCKFPLEMGGQSCVGGFAVDVTDQKNAEQRIKESEELFRTLLADLHTGVLLLDPESEVLLANQAALDLLGMTSEQLIGKRAFDADWKALKENGAVLPQFEHPVLKAIKTQVPVRGAIVSKAGRSGNGSAWLQIDSIPGFDEAGNLKHVIATFSDITDLKTAMEALKISRNEYRRIVETAYEGVWMVDAAGRTVFTNERFAEMLGYTAEEIKDKSVLELIGSDARLGKIQESERQKDRPKSQFDAKLQHKNGSEVWGLVSAAPLYSDDGDFVGSLLMVTDITSRKTAEDQVHKMATRILNLQDEERRRIARALHDETAQDLAVLNMHISSLKRRIFQDDAGAREDLEKCQMLINNSLREVRTLSYLLHPPMLDDAGLIWAVRWYVEGFSNRSDIDVSLKLDETIGRLPTDVESALYRIVQEALTNIHRHSNSRTATVVIAEKENKILVRILDQGKGMPVRLADGHSYDVGSLGVGIMGMKQRLIEIGGTLSIKSGASGDDGNGNRSKRGVLS